MISLCGLIGFFSDRPLYQDHSKISTFLHQIRHRGPDHQGLVVLEGKATRKKQQIALGHVRFSLVDLSEASNQPMTTSDGRVCITLNGEIYNYKEIRAELEDKGHRFSTTSDTEVMAVAYQCWGEACFDRLNGFWAVALFDHETQRLLLARDRLGKAPLYIHQRAGQIFWASELKSLLSFFPDERSRIHLPAVAHYANWLRKDFGNETFFENFHTFPAASHTWVSDSAEIRPLRYWQVPGRRFSEAELSVDDAIGAFRDTATEAVRIRMRADARVAVQLSGGMDSSTLLALAAKRADNLDVYTIKHNYSGEDEENFARSVKERFSDKLNYNVIRLSEKSYLDELPEFAGHMDEPFHSPNQLSNQRIWREMKDRGIRAVLYGGGGDEVFSGYVSDYFAPHLRSLLGQGKALSFAKDFIGCSEISGDFAFSGHMKMLVKMANFAPTRATHGKARFIPKSINPLAPEMLDLLDRRPPTKFNELMQANMGDWRMNYWLRNDNQNSMRVPIELRMPLLDYKVIELAFALPESYLIRDGWMKWIMRKSMADDLPEDVVWRRKKMGFPFPLREWLDRHKGELLGMVCGTDCPFICKQRLQRHYDELRIRDADYLWGLLSILLWWTFAIQNPHAK